MTATIVWGCTAMTKDHTLCQSATEALAMIRHEFRHRYLMACLVQGRPKKVRQVKSKVKSMLIIFFDIKGIVHKEFVLAGQTANSTYYHYILLQLCENV
jgi:hypothetical protein